MNMDVADQIPRHLKRSGLVRVYRQHPVGRYRDGPLGLLPPQVRRGLAGQGAQVDVAQPQLGPPVQAGCSARCCCATTPDPGPGTVAELVDRARRGHRLRAVLRDLAPAGSAARRRHRGVCRRGAEHLGAGRRLRGRHGLHRARGHSRHESAVPRRGRRRVLDGGLQRARCGGGAARAARGAVVSVLLGSSARAYSAAVSGERSQWTVRRARSRGGLTARWPVRVERRPKAIVAAALVVMTALWPCRSCRCDLVPPTRATIRRT